MTSWALLSVSNVTAPGLGAAGLPGMGRMAGLPLLGRAVSVETADNIVAAARNP